MPRLGVILLLAVFSLSATAQTRLSSQVRAENSKAPLAGVSVRVVGQPVGTTTDDNGRFTLDLSAAVPNPILAFSHLGYQTVNVPVVQLGTDVLLPEQSYLIGEVAISYAQLRQLLLRRWMLDSACVRRMVHADIARARIDNPTFAVQLARDSTLFIRSLVSSRREFRDNGVFRTKGGLAAGRGRWQLNEQTRTLTMDDAAGGYRQTTVVELTPNRLVLQREGREAIVYVPAED